jgi:IS30 family transposase
LSERTFLAGLASGSSIRDIAKGLERAASTVSREVARHGGRPEYRANEADQRAWDSALRPKRCLLPIHVKLQKVVASKLILDWSPEQISGWLKIQYPDDESMRVSHETIYRSLFIQARGVLKKELLGHLRTKRRIRRSQHARIFKDLRGQIVDAISIRERPALPAKCQKGSHAAFSDNAREISDPRGETDAFPFQRRCIPKRRVR